VRKSLLVAMIAAAAIAGGTASVQAQPYGPGMMGGWGNGWYGFGILHMAIWVAFLIAIIVGAVWLVRSVAGGQAVSPPRPAGLDVLEERYARGEIKQEEYLQKKRDMSG